MKNKGLIIAIVLVVLAIVGYFLLSKKKEEAKATTTTQESTTGVTALFNTGAMSTLFGGFGKAASSVGSAVDNVTKEPTK